MRQIKAKAFDEERKVFTRAKLVENESSNWIDERGFPVVWYTGLNDRNGVEIYEGDIVQDKWNNCITQYMESGYYPFEYSGGGEMIAEESAVIGSIYENPELMEK